jgi:hypothetical protein
LRKTDATGGIASTAAIIQYGTTKDRERLYPKREPSGEGRFTSSVENHGSF